MLPQYQEIVRSCGSEMEAVQVINSLVKTFNNNKVKKEKLNHMLNWVKKEIENPTPVDGYTLEEKVSSLKKQKEELSLKMKDFDKVVNEHMSGLREFADKVNPNLYTYAHAKFLTLECMGEL